MGGLMTNRLTTEQLRVIKSIIRHYPVSYVEWHENAEEIIHGSGSAERTGSGHVSDPTASKVMRLHSDHMDELQRQYKAVGRCLAGTQPDYRRVVCLYFWGVDSESNAMQKVRNDERISGMTTQEVAQATGCDDKLVSRILGRFIFNVDSRLQKT